jgi:predicted dehydrogenase
VEIAAACDPVDGVAKAFTEAFGGEVAASVDALLEDPRVEGVIAAVPNPVHEEVVTACARAGKPVLVEKPLANTVAECRRMIDACAAASVLLAVGHNSRRRAGPRMMKELVDSGEVGVPAMFEGNFSHTGSRRLTDEKWRSHRDRCPGGPMNVLGIHLIDTLQHLMGPCESVACVLSSVAAPVDMDDAVAFIMRMRSGALAYVGAGYSFPSTKRIRVLGSEAIVECNGDVVTIKRDPPGDPERRGTTREELEAIDTVREEIEEFARASRGECAFETTGEVALRSVAVLEAGLRSAAEKREVTIDEVMG